MSAGLLAQGLGAIPDVVAVKDREQRYLVVNAACAAVIGHPVTAIVGRTDDGLYPPAERCTGAERHDDAQADGSGADGARG